MNDKGLADIKEKILSTIRQVAIPAIAAAVASGVTYFVCDNIHNEEVAVLHEQIAELENTAKEAKVTQRISEQMEDIAFQQKGISDKQRQAAEEQKKIADIERGKAEIERGLAQAAERKALASADEAQQMRLLADQQKEEAVRNMKAAELARAQTDTLYYLSLGATLAQSALSFGNNVNNLTRLLAYSSWYYTKEYGGDVYDENIFKALLYSSNNLERINSILKGNVRAIKMVDIHDVRWAIGVTDIGEMFCYNTKKEHRFFTAGNFNFRDMDIINDEDFVTITSNGNVNVFGYTSMDKKLPTEKQTTSLPGTLWRKIRKLKDQDALIAISDTKAVWLDTKTLKVIAEQPLDGDPTTIGFEDNIIHIFGKSNIHYISEKPGIIVKMPLSAVNMRITAYHYVKDYNYHVIGAENGNIYIINNKGEIATTLTGHEGAITALGCTERFIVSTGYDRRLRYWDISNGKSIIANFTVGFDKWPLTFTIDPKEVMIWIGNADGHVNRYCIDPNMNALSTQSLITSDFTKVEWDRYIGPLIPFRSFMRQSETTKEGGKQ